MSEEAPWWYWRCTHRDKDLESWRVLLEAEQAVILYAESDTLVHVTVDIAGVGSVCKSLQFKMYRAMTEQDLLALVQSQARDLRTIL